MKTAHNCHPTYIIGLIIGTIFIAGNAFQASEGYSIIDTHEHIKSIEQAEALISSHESIDISKIIIVPTPEESLMLNGNQSFTKYHENTNLIFEIAEEHPNIFIPFCTINPLDEDALEYLTQCHERGGKGLRLYNGNSYYYNIFQMPLDAQQMLPIYAYAEVNNLPIQFHVNIREFENELRSVLDQFPNLVVSVPHYMISSIQLDKVANLLDTYPNLYTDISFGAPQFLAAGFRRINRNPTKFINFINNYSNRILFGGDIILTNNNQVDQTLIDQTLQCYKDLLEQKTFTCSPVIDYYTNTVNIYSDRYDECEPKEGNYCSDLKDKMNISMIRMEQVSELSGLNLNNSILKKIYEKNPLRFLGNEIEDTTDTDEEIVETEEVAEEEVVEVEEVVEEEEIVEVEEVVEELSPAEETIEIIQDDTNSQGDIIDIVPSL